MGLSGPLINPGLTLHQINTTTISKSHGIYSGVVTVLLPDTTARKTHALFGTQISEVR